MKTEEFSIAKGQVEIYKIRHPSGMYWADITIDSNGSKGRIQIASDWGDYQYFWGACGSDFKEFLAKIDVYYAAGKFGASDWFDIDKTIRGYKLTVLESRRHDWITSEKARDIFDEINELKDYIHKTEFINEAYSKPNLAKFFDHELEVMTDITPQFRKFWNTCWRVLLNEFEKEKQLA